MKQFEIIGNKVLGSEFIVTAQRDGIDIKSSSGGYAIVVGFLSYPGIVQVRDNAVVMKRFERVEDVVGPILKKNSILFKSYGGYQATIQQVLPLRELLSTDHISFIDRKDIPIGDANTINDLFVALKKVFDYAQLTFVSKYATLSDVFEHSDRMTPKERGEFFASPAPIRKIVVDCYCDKDFQFDSRFDQLKSELQLAEVNYPSIFKNQPKAIGEIAEYIKQQRSVNR